MSFFGCGTVTRLFGRVLELNVAAVLIDLEPAIILQGLDDVRDVFIWCIYTH